MIYWRPCADPFLWTTWLYITQGSSVNSDCCPCMAGCFCQRHTRREVPKFRRNNSSSCIPRSTGETPAGSLGSGWYWWSGREHAVGCMLLWPVAPSCVTGCFILLDLFLFFFMANRLDCFSPPPPAPSVILHPDVFFFHHWLNVMSNKWHQNDMQSWTYWQSWEISTLKDEICFFRLWTLLNSDECLYNNCSQVTEYTCWYQTMWRFSCSDGPLIFNTHCNWAERLIATGPHLLQLQLTSTGEDIHLFIAASRVGCMWQCSEFRFTHACRMLHCLPCACNPRSEFMISLTYWLPNRNLCNLYIYIY